MSRYDDDRVREEWDRRNSELDRKDRARQQEDELSRIRLRAGIGGRGYRGDPDDDDPITEEELERNRVLDQQRAGRFRRIRQSALDSFPAHPASEQMQTDLGRCYYSADDVSEKLNYLMAEIADHKRAAEELVKHLRWTQGASALSLFESQVSDWKQLEQKLLSLQELIRVRGW